MKKILVATDLSERSDRAVRRAFRLASDHGATCRVVYVVDDTLPQDIAAGLQTDAETQLRQFVDVNKGDTDAECVVLVGDPLLVIPAEAIEHAADLVVLGIHRPRAFLDQLYETTMERLVRRLRKPVLLVSAFVNHSYANILVPVSFSPACAAALTASRTIAPHANVTTFHALHIPFSGFTGEQPGGDMDHELRAEAQSVLSEWRRKEGLSEEDSAVELITGAYMDVLPRKLAEVKPDLIALGAHNRSDLAPYALGGFTAKLIRKPPTDLLLTRP